MKTKLIGIIICMLLVGTVLPVSGTLILDKTTTCNVSGNILYVGGSGEGNYTKIQDAINDAFDGDTIFVYDDSAPYYENLIVDKSINLIGENRDTTVIDGSGSEDVIRVSTDGVTVNGFTIQKGSYGIYIYSNSNTITDNIISNNSYGIRVYESDSNIIIGNTFSNHYIGIFLYHSSNNIISDNSFFNEGLRVSWSYQNTVSNNTVNGKPLVYLERELHKVIDYEVGQVILVNCNAITVENLNIYNTDVGIELWKTDWSIIRNNDFSNNKLGMALYGDGNTVTGNTISNNLNGISLYESSGNNITGNIISNNNYDGIDLRSSKSNTISNNNISNNKDGIYLSGYDGSGFEFGEIFYGGSINNIILKNNFIDNERDAFFSNSFRNQWKQNYWNKPQILPKIIHGEISWWIFSGFGIMEFSIPWFPQIDWRPAKEPYDI